MTNQELIAKFNSLKKISPDQNWLKSNREFLLSQISNSGAEKLPTWRILVIDFTSALKSAAQPAYALAVFILLIFSGGLFSSQILAKTKPNDSLYIARVISEKVKVNTTFDSAQRDKLAAQFATEHAQDITVILADPAFNTEANKDQVAKLNDSFKEEVNTVKARISRLPQTIKNKPAVAISDNVTMADNSKEGEGIQLLEKNPVEPLKTSGTIESTGPAAASTTLEVSSTPETQASSTLNIEENSTAADKILDEANKLFDQKDYTKAADKLKEVDQIIK